MYLEFTNVRTGILEHQQLQHCFHLGTFAQPIGCEERQGFCIGFQMPHKSIKESMEFYDKLMGDNGNKGGYCCVIYFCNEKQRIPVNVFSLDGNLYDDCYDSSCLFGYVSPFLFASQKRPEIIKKKNELGSFIMGHYEGPMN